MLYMADDRIALSDTFRTAIDIIEMNPDPAERVALFTYVIDTFDREFRDRRDKAAYEAHLAEPAHIVATRAGVYFETLLAWSNRWRTSKGLPRVHHSRWKPVPARTLSTGPRDAAAGHRGS
jgi:hypothetical protein